MQKNITVQIPKYIDVHAHLNFSAYDQDRHDVIEKTVGDDVWMINVGTQQRTSQEAVDLAQAANGGVYAIVGLHPIHTARSFHDTEELGEGGKEFTSHGETVDVNFYQQLAQSPKVVGIGETGLDYFHNEDDTFLRKQKEAFIAQIHIANAVNKPLMLHVRSGKTGPSAYADVLEILRSEAKVPGNVHFFAGSIEEARQFLDLGFTISFTGVITFASEYAELVSYVPLDSILSETDCPYVTPVPYRGKRNEPVFVKEVVKKIAEIKGQDESVVAPQLVQNAFRMFGL